ncbi:MAG: rhodanese-like domain-containing protein [Candidatus Thiodiazotropha sp. (ex Ctena orbiculata)]|nr:rhodanese-like domain-containing protein [Candidatus Thiodiazotropha taylori]
MPTFHFHIVPVILKHTCHLCLTIALAFSINVHADSLPQNNIVRQDTNIPAIAECKNEIIPDKTLKTIKLSDQNQSQSTPKEYKGDFKCLSTVKNVHSDWKRGKALLVDIRDVKLYNKNKIPNSINLPLYMLKVKNSLQNRPLVLVNKGTQLAILEQSCQALKEKGFKQIAVLQDGLKAWSDAGYPITGDKMAIQGFSDLTPAELMGIINERDWVFIDLDHSSKALRHLISVPSVIEYSEDLASLSEELAAFKATRKPGVITGFLVISQDGRQNGIIKKRFQDFGIKDVYYLSGGVSEFKRFAQTHAAQVERLRKGFQVRMGCNG